MKDKKILWLLGLYLIADGLISIYHFRDEATQIENLFRIIRALIGLYFVRLGK